MSAPREVKMKLTVDAGDVAKASAAMKDLANSTRQVSQAAGTHGTGGAGGAGGTPGPQPGYSGSPSPSARLPGPLKTLLGFGTANAVLGGAVRSLQVSAASGRPLNLTNAAVGGLESVPLVGNAFKLARLADGGYADIQSNATLQAQQRIAAARREELALRIATGNQLGNLRLQGAEAAAGAAGATGFYNRIRGRGGDFVTDDRLGVSTANTGAARLAVEQAQNNLQTARERERIGQEALVAQRAKVAGAIQQRDKSLASAGSAASAAANAQYISDSSTFGTAKRDRAREAREAAAAAQERADNDVKRAAMEIKELESQIAQQKERQLNTAKSQLEVGQKQVDQLRDQQAIAGGLRGVLRSGAEQFGFGTKAENRRVEQAALKFGKTRDVGSLSRRELEALQRFAPAQEALANAARERGANDPGYDRALKALGNTETLSQVEARYKQIAAQIAEQQAKIDAEFQTRMAEVTKENIQNLATIFTEAMKQAIAEIRSGEVRDKNERNNSTNQ